MAFSTDALPRLPQGGPSAFAGYTQQLPGTFYVLGVGNEDAGITHGLHTPRFTVDEEALRLGPGFMAYIAWQRGNTSA